MHRIAPFLVLILAASPAMPQEEAAEEGRRIAEFRLKKDTSTLRGWILEPDDDGFRFEHLGGKGRRTILWDDLMPEDARALRIEFGLEMTEEERKGLIPGHEVTFRGGGSVRGIVVERGEDGSLKVMTAGLVRIGEAAQRIRDGSARRAVAHATSGPCLQQNLVCVLEGDG